MHFHFLVVRENIIRRVDLFAFVGKALVITIAYMTIYCGSQLVEELSADCIYTVYSLVKRIAMIISHGPRISVIIEKTFFSASPL